MSLTRRLAELDLLVKGEHRDPFSVLGPHLPPGARGVVVRAFLPGASAVELRPGDPALPARPAARIHPDGVFQATYPEARDRFAYRLRVTWESGLGADLEDPYRFPSTMGDLDLLLLGEGTHYRLSERLGAHPATVDGVTGVVFAVWAPNAARVSVVGDFNAWDGRRHPMRLHPGNGVWELFLPGVAGGARYKFEVLPADRGVPFYKADPLAFAFEADEPRTSSTVWVPGGHAWGDADWMAARAARNALAGPLCIYEVHLGSWRRAPGDEDRFLSYQELGRELGDYVADLGYTHVELLPVLEHPFYGSWGYQALGFFAPTRRYGEPEDFMAFVDELHRRGIGVILDWVPAHFPRDAHGLAWFDGTHLYEHADPRQREHPDWGTLVFNYGRNEVANFLIASALHWLDRYHLDGLRVDAVASMLYLDYSKSPGEWVPNRYGGRENVEAIAFIRRFNEVVYREHPGVITIAEESTSWPQVSRPTYVGGLGFGAKWNMGWMHDVLDYFQKDPVHRKFHHDRLTFGLLYAWHENFVLPLSHDEVVHGKGSLHGKMPGDDWQRFANLRALYGFMYGYPGKKLLFMGGEFGQTREWSHDRSLDWHLLDAGPYHRGLQALVRDLNHLYRAEPALWEVDFEPAGFQWMDCSDADQSVVSFVRRTRDGRGLVLVACNFTPVVRRDYRVGAPRPGYYRERVNTDAAVYGGGNVGNGGGARAERVPAHGQPCSVRLALPPLAVVFLTPDPA